MNLTDYFLKNTEDRAYKLADRAGVARSMVYDLIIAEGGGKARHVSMANAKKISRASQGLITPTLIGEPPPQTLSE